MSEKKSFYLTNRRRVMSRIFKRGMDLSDISLISMNCIGGIMYYDLSQRFLSPTVNLFFAAEDFFKFVLNLDYYLALTPEVTEGEEYPIGTLGDIKINFMHYKTPKEALTKWEERKKRINPNKIFVIAVERNGFSEKDFESFKKVPYPKLLYTKTKAFRCEEALYMGRYKDEPQIPDIIPGRFIYDKMKIKKAIKRAYDL